MGGEDRGGYGVHCLMEHSFSFGRAVVGGWGVGGVMKYIV